MRRFSEKELAWLGDPRASWLEEERRKCECALALVRSDAVRELLSDDRGVHGGTLEHRHRNRGDGATPIGLELLGPRRRPFADGTNEDVAHNEVVLRLRTPSHVLCAEIPERILQHRHVFQVSDHQRQRGLEMSLKRDQVNGKQQSKTRRSREQLLVGADG